MDIKDYLYAIRRRLWLPIVLPLIAALVTAGFLYLQPEQYQATATVVVPALSAKGSSTSAVTQYVSTFKDVLISAPVVDRVSGETGENRNNVASGLTASTTTASSNIILVNYTGPRKTSVQTVAQSAAVTALDALLGPQLSAANSAMATSQGDLDTANKALTDFTTVTGLLFPDVDYKIKSLELSQLLVQLQEANLAHDNARVKGLTQVVALRQAELTKLAPQVAQFQVLSQARSSAEAVHNTAATNLSKVNAEIASDHDPRSVSVRFTGHVSRIPEILRFAGVAFGVALLLTLVFIVFMEFFRPAVPVGVAGVEGAAPLLAIPRLGKSQVSKTRAIKEVTPMVETSKVSNGSPKPEPEPEPSAER